MGCLVTRPGLARHSYRAGHAGAATSPGRMNPLAVTAHAVTATIMSPRSGATVLPLSAPIATYAADGAPFYNSGYLPGYQSTALPGGLVRLQPPPLAAMVDLANRQSWDRPVFFPSAR